MVQGLLHADVSMHQRVPDLSQPDQGYQDKRIWRGRLVPVERIELPTFGLQNRCSTAELNRQTK